MNSANSQFMDGTLKFIELSSFAIKRAGDEINIHRLQQKKAADLRSGMLDHLINSGMVAPSMRKQAEEMLASHEQTLYLLKAAVDRAVESQAKAGAKTAADLGSGAPDPGAPATGRDDPNWSLHSNYIGEHTTEKKASDVALLRILDSPAR